MKTIVAIILCLVFAYTSNALGTEQRVIIKGKLTCGERAANNIRVRLVDIDFGSDDQMAEGRTNSNGEFQLDGKTSEIGTIEPVLKIYHNCADVLPGGIPKPCDRRLRFTIPDKYIGKKGVVPKTLDMGTWNLMPYYKDEDRDCIH